MIIDEKINLLSSIISYDTKNPNPNKVLISVE